MRALRNWRLPALFAALTLIQGCGGGGGSGSPSPAAAAAINTIVVIGSNAQPISVDAGLGGAVNQAVNQAFTSVTLCPPGSSNCQTIDHIVVDTGSSGLRIMSSVLAPTLLLPQQTQANGDPVAECAQFADGITWGPVKLADLKIAGEHANGLPIQVIGDPDPHFADVPPACLATGKPKNKVSALGANGILGLGVFRQDCESCAGSVTPGIYYACPLAGCRSALTPVALQVQQPVSKFAVNNNGVIIELPSVPDAGAASVGGSLVFGIGTQANNALGAAKVISVDPSTGTFHTIYNSIDNFNSFIDSGSNGLFFNDARILICANASSAPGFYCPASTFNGVAAIQLANGSSATVNFSVANADTLVTSNLGFAAFGNLGGPQVGTNSFDWGLPFFYGRKVYTAIEGTVTPGGPAGPYLAF